MAGTMMLLPLLASASSRARRRARSSSASTRATATLNFNPFDHPERYFAPRLMAAIKEDAELAHGEVGYVDGDPICHCQDPDGLHASVTTVTLNGRAKRPSASRSPSPATSRAPTTYTLVRTSAGWRIADVSSADEPSFLARHREVQPRNARKALAIVLALFLACA